MRWSLVLAFCFSLCVLPALAQEKMTQSEILEIQEQVAQADRQMEDYEDALSRLGQAAKQSSSTGRSSAIDRLEKIQGDAILALESKVGEDYTIQRHGEEVQTVTTKQAEEETAGSTSRQKRVVYQDVAAEGVAGQGYRLVRMQQIYISCQQIETQAIDRQPGAMDRYLNLAREFATLMSYDRDQIFQSLPPEAQEEYMETMGK